VVALIAGGVWAGVSTTGNNSPQPVLAACAHLRGCSQVTLTATRTGRPAATVIVHDGTVSMEPAAMAANPGDEIYVLWQITGAHTPLAVGSFDIRPGSRAPLRIGGLAAPYSSTWAFAVSLEHGRTIPASPSRPIALGQVS
jgi:plastocyanin